MSDVVEQRLVPDTNRLKLQSWLSWLSSDRVWVAGIISLFGGAEEMVEYLKTAVFPNREIKMMVVKNG